LFSIARRGVPLCLSKHTFKCLTLLCHLDPQSFFFSPGPPGVPIVGGVGCVLWMTLLSDHILCNTNL
jgi:hypothetical protein